MEKCMSEGRDLAQHDTYAGAKLLKSWFSPEPAGLAQIWAPLSVTPLFPRVKQPGYSCFQLPDVDYVTPESCICN